MGYWWKIHCHTTDDFPLSCSTHCLTSLTLPITPASPVSLSPPVPPPFRHEYSHHSSLTTTHLYSWRPFNCASFLIKLQYVSVMHYKTSQYLSFRTIAWVFWSRHIPEIKEEDNFES